ncbi:MAG: hypothetical protein IJM51_04210 [Clostridia bacterium]|nr:hypothetical protein [Clostridia bacterium]
MKKIRKLAAFFLATVMMTSAVSCQKEVTAENLMENIGQNNASEVDLDETFCKKYASQAFTMLNNEYTSDGGNVVISPLAAYYNLSMLANGADNYTLSEIERTLSGFMKFDALNDYMHSFAENLKDTDNAKLYFENALWCNADKNVTPSNDFLSVAKTYYNADAYKESFGKEAVTNINNWASNKTDMNAEYIVDTIPSDAPLFVVNTTVLDANWESPISPENVSDGIFRSSTSQEESVQMMSSYEYIFMGNDEINGFAKKYSGGNYAFVAFVSKNENQASLSNLITYLSNGTNYRTLIKDRKERVIDASIPKFSCEYKGGMKNMLETLGVTKAFSSESASFGNFGTADDRLYVGDINVFTGINVTEKGTSKGTGANVTNSNVATSVIPISLNRPFVFAVVDTKKFLPVIVGAVNTVKG